MGAHSKQHEDFLISTTVEGRTWHWLWDHPEPLGIDHPSLWEVVKDSTGVKLVHRAEQREIEVTSSHLSGEKDLKVPATPGSREFTVHFKKLKRIRPAYLPDLKAIQNFGPADHYASAGIREHLIGFNPLEGKTVCKVEDEKIFEITVEESYFKIKANRPGVKFKAHGQESVALNPGQMINLSFTEIYSGSFIYGSYWWRFNKVPTPEMMDLDELDREEAAAEVISLKQLGKMVAGFAAVVVGLMQAVHYMQLYQDSHKKKPETAQVELKKPKYIPIAEKPKPTPVPPPKVVEKPKPTPAPKVAQKPKPKPKPAPQKVVQKPKPKKPEPIKVAQKPAPALKPPPKPVVQPKVPPPVKVVQAPPAPPAPPQPKPVVQPKAPDPSVVAAQQKAAIAKSLNFLSTGPSKNVNALATAPGAKLSQKYETAGSGALPATQSALNQLAKSNTGSGPISTSSARTVASNSGIRGGHGKGLNQVQGKVALNALYGSGSGDALAGAMGGGGMTVSGPGSLSDAEIEKTLAKYLQKLQFCYEKALLSDSALGGTVQIQWTITEAGTVTGQSVTRSEMNNAGLHGCLMKEFAKMQFPRPKGGGVTVKKPFKFEATAM